MLLTNARPRRRRQPLHPHLHTSRISSKGAAKLTSHAREAEHPHPDGRALRTLSAEEGESHQWCKPKIWWNWLDENGWEEKEPWSWETYDPGHTAWYAEEDESQCAFSRQSSDSLAQRLKDLKHRLRHELQVPTMRRRRSQAEWMAMHVSTQERGSEAESVLPHAVDAPSQ